MQYVYTLWISDNNVDKEVECGVAVDFMEDEIEPCGEDGNHPSYQSINAELFEQLQQHIRSSGSVPLIHNT